MKKQHALIIDDEPDIRELLELTLGRMGIDTSAAANLADARDMLDNNRFDLCLTDMRLPDGDGLDLVAWIQEHQPDLPVAVITAYGNMDAAIKALKFGAYDFVSKPVDLEVLRNLVNTALKLTSQTSQRERRSRDELLGDAEAMRKLRSKIAKLARSQAPVYISGESGTGKELVARLIHKRGPRADQPFIPVNCGAIPAELMESEFFGHIKGSFTGAVSDKEGLFQAANGGTLFLDEIAELPLNMQVKLLRAIQEKAVRPVGTQREIPVDVRILSATHKDLSILVNDGHFRQDLYYRINVIELTVPSLRQRKDDIPILADHFLHLLARRNGCDYVPLGEAAGKALIAYPFPGNVRELENILERALTLCEGGEITPEDLHLPEVELPEQDRAIDDKALDPYLENKEKEAILKALEQTRYNKTAAAKLLGITFRALRYRLKKFDID